MLAIHELCYGELSHYNGQIVHGVFVDLEQEIRDSFRRHKDVDIVDEVLASSSQLDNLSCYS